MQPDLSTALERLTGAVVREAKAIGGQHGVGHYRAALADGRMVFVKAAGAGGAAAAAPALAAEANGLRWLAEAAAVPVPEVLGCADGLLAISWIAQEKAGRRSAEAFGRDLARMHAAGPGRLGAPWPGFIAGLPLGNADGGTWPPWYARERGVAVARAWPGAGWARARGGGGGSAAPRR